MITKPDEGLPILKLTRREFEELRDYSATMPTGVIIGKRWKRLDGCFDQRFLRAGGKPRWVVGEYVTTDDPKMAGYKWYKPVVVVKSGVSK